MCMPTLQSRKNERTQGTRANRKHTTSHHVWLPNMESGYNSLWSRDVEDLIAP